MAANPKSALKATAGLAALLDQAAADADAARTGALSVRVDAIRQNPNQPRKHFDQAKLEELAESIKERGLIEPVVVRRLAAGDTHEYELVAGERRWRAHQLIPLDTITAVVRDYDEPRNASEDALVENIQREDLTVHEEADAVEELIARHGGGRGAIDTVAKTLGKTKQWVHERHQLATAPEFVRVFIASGRSTDRRGLYDLTVLASKDADLAQQVIDEFTDGTSLRKAVADIKDPDKRAQQASPSALEGEDSFRLGSGSADASDAPLRPGPRVVRADDASPSPTPPSDGFAPSDNTPRPLENDFQPLESPLALPGDDSAEDTFGAEVAPAPGAYPEGPTEELEDANADDSAPRAKKKTEKPSPKKPDADLPDKIHVKIVGARFRGDELILETAKGPTVYGVASRAALDTLLKAIEKKLKK